MPTRTDNADTGYLTLRQQPFTLLRPPVQKIPFVFSSPHSGRLYPQSFVDSSRLGGVNLRRSEDAFVDRIFTSVVALGAPLITARFPRALVDANRAPTELDPSMFDGELTIPVDPASPRVSAGLGVIPRIVRHGLEIYDEKVSAQAAEERLHQFHRPYHAALGQLVRETHATFGVALLIDCHSMPSGAAGPDVILGDRHGLSSAAYVTLAARRAFEELGFTVARNVPYAGGYTTQLYGRPAQGTHSLQIEINRALYLDEEAISLKPAFGSVCSRIAAAIERLVDLCAMSGLPAFAFPQAAE